MAESVTEQSLGDYVRLQRGTTYKSALLGKPGPILLGLASIARNGGFRGENLKTYGGHSDSRILLRPGDIYVSLKDVTQSADLLGAVSRVPDSVPSGRLTQDTVKLEFTRAGYESYLYWLLRTPDYRAYCQAHATGTTNLGLSREDFFAFPVPPLTEIRSALVTLLQYLENKIDLNRRMNETLEAMARAVFKDWFVDFGPTRTKMEGAQPYHASELWARFPERIDAEEIPEGWVSGALTDVATLNPESWNRTTYPSEIEYVDLANTKWGTIETTEAHAKSSAPSRAQRVLRRGDTIVGTVRPGNGSYAYVGRDGLTGSTGFAVLRPKHRRFAELCYLAATAPDNIERLSHLADGAAYPAVRPEIVAATGLTCSSEAVADAFSFVVGPLFERMEHNKREARSLAETRDLLLPKLMSGEIHIKEAEKAVAELV